MQDEWFVCKDNDVVSFLSVTRCMLCLYFTQDIVVHVTSILLDPDICKHCISFLQYLFLWTLLFHPIALPSLSLYLLFFHYLSSSLCLFLSLSLSLFISLFLCPFLYVFLSQLFSYKVYIYYL